MFQDYRIFNIVSIFLYTIIIQRLLLRLSMSTLFKTCLELILFSKLLIYTNAGSKLLIWFMFIYIVTNLLSNYYAVEIVYWFDKITYLKRTLSLNELALYTCI